MTFDKAAAEHLLTRPEFRAFLYEVIQLSGIFGNNSPADGRSVRDHSLEWLEGRRSLGHEILFMIEQGQPEIMQSPDGIPVATILTVLRETMNPEEPAHAGRRNSNNDRYDDDDGDRSDD